MNRSVKARVIALAMEDPFLTVENLANRAETTAPYVRTILSEAGLSLNRMRKDYARKLERRLGERAEESSDFELELTITQLKGEGVRPLVKSWAGKELSRARSLFRQEGHVFYGELFTPLELRVLTPYTNLRELLPISPEAAEQWAEIVTIPAHLAEALGMERDCQILKLSTLLQHKNELCALEVVWFSLDGLVLKWSKTDPELKISLTS